MAAFNGRFILKRLFGLPVRAVVGLAICLFSLTMTLIVPLWIAKGLFGLLCLLSFGVAMFFVIDGDNYVFRPIKYQSDQDANAKMIGDVGY